VSCYELGRQPLGLSTPLAFLERDRGELRVKTDAIDLAVEPLDEARVRRADFVAVSVPMHTALGIALRVLPRLRTLNPDAHICFYGLYATLNAELLLASGVDSVLSGECEEALVDRILRRSERSRKPAPFLERLDLPVPDRRTLLPLERYAGLALPDGTVKRVGAVESSRGCLHLCRHCPIPPVYGGRFFVVPEETVLADVRQLVDAGAEHIDFVDPDFLNGPLHALRIARALNREHPELTFDFTAKVEHLVRHRAYLPELRRLGCLFIVSAVESLSDRVLKELDKGHDRSDVLAALAITREAGIALRPTFVAFTPWTARTDYLELLRFIAREGLVAHVDPVQLTLRLLVPPGSLLLNSGGLLPHLGALDAAGLTYRWTHPEPEMDRLQEKVRTLVEGGGRSRRSSHDLFHEIYRLAAGDELLPGEPPSTPRTPSIATARLTEAWFC
jgi:radical SAM superfamily enzyme YgiQ (UPF0313 family)